MVESTAGEDRDSRMLWRGRVRIEDAHYTIGKPRGRFTEEDLARGLYVRPGGVFVFASLHATGVDLEVVLSDSGADAATEAAAEVTVPAGGWRLAGADGPIQRARSPLLGPGSWRLWLHREIAEGDSLVDVHRLYLAPADAYARTEAAVLPESQPAPPTGREPFYTRWLPEPGAYRIEVRRANENSGQGGDTEVVTHERGGEWFVQVGVDQLGGLGEKWTQRRTWALRTGDTLVVTDDAGVPVTALPQPLVAGPARVRAITRRADVGDIVEDQWVADDRDGIMLEAVIDG